MSRQDNKMTLDIEIISVCAECGKPVPVKLLNSTSYGLLMTIQVETEPHRCPVYCDNCGDQILEGKCGCEAEEKPKHHTTACKCRDCEDERADHIYHSRKDESLCNLH